jgi:hypothetical protein
MMDVKSARMENLLVLFVDEECRCRASKKTSSLAQVELLLGHKGRIVNDPHASLTQALVIVSSYLDKLSGDRATLGPCDGSH